jgi:hypothetical protein
LPGGLGDGMRGGKGGRGENKSGKYRKMHRLLLDLKGALRQKAF